MKTIYGILYALLLSSCSQAVQTTAQTEKDLLAAVMKIHDAVMPKTSTLLQSKQNLLVQVAKLDSLAAQQKGLDITPKRKIAMHMIHLLDSANHSMSDWMQAFKIDFEGENHQQIIDYLQGELLTINQVDSLYTHSLQKADSLLKTFRR